MSKVHIITINYKNWQDTIECLESIKLLDYRNIEIVLMEVCDLNNSLINLKKYLKDYPFKLKLIELSENNGFAYANNQAIKYIQTQNEVEYIWLLNNDTVVKRKTLSALLNFYDNNIVKTNIGFVGSKILEYNEPEIIQTVGGNFNPKKGYSKLIGKGEKDINQYNSDFKADYVIGASMFFQKNLLNIIGFMPEEYFLYYEDIDWCFAASKKGYSNYTCVDSVVLHKQGGSTGNKYTKKTTNLYTRKYMYSSYLKFYKNHFNKYIIIAYVMLHKQFVGRIIRRQFKEAKIILKSIYKT